MAIFSPLMPSRTPSTCLRKCTKGMDAVVHPHRPFLLRLPYPLDTLGKADVVGLELVKPKGHDSGAGKGAPFKELPALGGALGREIVDDDVPARVSIFRYLTTLDGLHVLESHVRVDDDEPDQSGVEDGVQGPSSKGSDRDGDQADGDEALRRPVVASVCGVWLGDRSRVIDWTLL